VLAGEEGEEGDVKGFTKGQWTKEVRVELSRKAVIQPFQKGRATVGSNQRAAPCGSAVLNRSLPSHCVVSVSIPRAPRSIRM